MTIIDTSLIDLTRPLTEEERRAAEDEADEFWRETMRELDARDSHPTCDARSAHNGHIPTDAERMRDTRRQFLTTVLGEEGALARLGNGSLYAYVWEHSPPPGNGAHRPSFSYWSQKIATLLNDSEDRGQSRNYYLGTSLTEGAHSDQSRASKDTFCGLIALNADVDIVGPAHKATQLPRDAAEARHVIAAAGFTPTVVVNTGHGYQAWYCLAVPWTWGRDDAATRARALRLLAAWGEHVQSVGKRLGYALDNTSDAARVLRLAGSYNYKWAEDGTPLPVVEATIDSVPGERYTVEELEAFLGLGDTSGDEKTSDTSGDARAFSGTEEAAIALAASVLAPGKRWERVKSFCGMLAHGGMSEDAAARLMKAICDRCPGIDRAREMTTLHHTYALAHKGEPCAGAPALAKQIGDDGWPTVTALMHLLRLDSAHAKYPNGATAPAARAFPQPIGAAACYGALGQIAREVEPFIEADSSALYINLLTQAGISMGRSPCLHVGAQRHYGVIYSVTVGFSGDGKTDSVAAIDAIQREVKSLPETTRNPNGTTTLDTTHPDIANPALTPILRGLSSGEGFLHKIRDDRKEMKPDRKTHDMHEVVTLGVEDKRLLVRENEFARIFQVMAREGNTLGSLIRDLYDSPEKAESSPKVDPITVTRPHVGMLAQITPQELNHLMHGVDLYNGFANRYVYPVTWRVKSLPLPPDYTDKARQHAVLWRDAMKRASAVEKITFDDEAGAVWRDLYEPLRQGRDDYPARVRFAREICTRAHVAVLRFALILAAVDGSSVITLPILNAAVAAWDYCERSALFLFSEVGGSPMETAIAEALEKRGKMTRNEIMNLFDRNVTSAQLQEALEALAEDGRARTWTAPAEKRGRPTEWWGWT